MESDLIVMQRRVKEMLLRFPLFDLVVEIAFTFFGAQRSISAHLYTLIAFENKRVCGAAQLYRVASSLHFIWTAPAF